MKDTLIVTQHPSLGGGTESIRSKIDTKDVDFFYETDSPLKILKHLFDRNVPKGYKNYLVMGGVCLGGYSFLKSDVPYTIWCASTVWDEWKTLKPNIFDNGLIRTGLYYFNTMTMPFTRMVEQAVLERAKMIYATSNYSKKKIIEEYNIPEYRIRIAHPPIKFYREKVVYKKGNYLIFVGRIDKRKNLKMLIEVMNHMPDKHLVIVGRGDHGALIKQQKFDNVKYTGEISEKEKMQLIKNAEAMVIVSNQEGFCISIAEAMEQGCPVISTRCGGPEDLIDHDKSGYLVDKEDVTDMMRKIRLLKQFPSIRNKFIINSRKKIKEMCCYKNTVARVLDGR
jgi:glycosyltransferase involved in cell wall biosynthesis